MSRRQPRLAILIHSMFGGGAERVMLNLAEGIVNSGFDVDLVLARAEGPFLKEVPNSVRVVNLNAKRVLTCVPALIRYLRRTRPDAVLSALGYVNIVALWARRLAGVSPRLVVSEHTMPSTLAQHAPSYRNRLMPHLMQQSYRWADGIVAVSEGTADDLAHVTGLPRSRIQVIYNPVVTPAMKQKAQAAMDHPWFEPGSPPVILSAGRFQAPKDFSTLIKAFAQVRATRPARLLILGDGPQRRELEALVRRLGLSSDVNMPGFFANPYPYMARASVFVLSSQQEGLPGVLIEALYCGAPLVATDCRSGPREILQDGKYGRLVPVGDVKALTEAISTTLADNRPRPRADGWRPFELHNVVDQYIALLLGSAHV